MGISGLDGLAWFLSGQPRGTGVTFTAEGTGSVGLSCPAGCLGLSHWLPCPGAVSGAWPSALGGRSYKGEVRGAVGPDPGAVQPRQGVLVSRFLTPCCSKSPDASVHPKSPHVCPSHILRLSQSFPNPLPPQASLVFQPSQFHLSPVSFLTADPSVSPRPAQTSQLTRGWPQSL